MEEYHKRSSALSDGRFGVTALPYDWTRYWCPRDGGEIHLDESGYLDSPEGVFGAALNPDLVKWDRLLEHRCLVLLGEPGTGKTSTIKAWKESVERTASTADMTYLWTDVSGYSEDRLRRRVLEHDTIRRWRDGNFPLTLVVDGYDEAATPTLGFILAEELGEWDLNRLSIAIACRTMEWPASLEQELRRLWRDTGAVDGVQGEAATSVGVYELAPLTYDDVVLAARTTLPDADGFLRDVSTIGLGMLAAKPLTLNFLLELFHRDQRLPPSQADVYEAGFRLTAAESNQRRRDVGLAVEYTPDERLAVASRIAAVLAFANRTAVWTRVEDASVTDRDVSVAELAGGTEPTRSGTVAVTERAFDETLGSGLFSGRGADRAGFWHQSAEDYLAAWYLRNRRLDPDQVMALLVHPSDEQGRIAPRLRAVAAWAAALVPGVLPRIVAADPEVLIGSDVQIVDPQRREELVETLIEMFDREDLAFTFHGPTYRFNRFAHPRLAAQLRPWIRAPGEGEGRIAALRIAAQCQVHELGEDALAVAFDTTQPRRVRIDAVAAAGRLLAPDERTLLRPLAFAETDEDPAEQLKGYALQFLFPSQLSLAETLSAITPPRTGSLSGSYEHFLAFHLPENVSDDDVPAALEWLAGPGRVLAGWFAIGHLTDHLMRRAWQHIDRDDVQDAIARVAWRRLKHDQAIWQRVMLEEDKTDLLDDMHRRRRLLGGVVRLLGGVEREAYHLLYGNTPVVRPEDVPWMAEQAVVDPPNSAVWTWLLSRTANIDDPRHGSAILEAAEHSSAVRDRFAWALGERVLTERGTRKLKADHLREVRNTERRLRRSSDRTTSPTGPEIQRLLLLAEDDAGHDRDEPGAFWQLLHVLRLESDGRAGASQFQFNVAAFPGWIAADTSTRQRILSVAQDFLRGRVPPVELLLGEGRIHWVAPAGYMALRLLHSERPACFAGFDRSFWERWIPSILTIEILRGYNQRDLGVLRLAHVASPRVFADEFVLATEAEISTNGRAWGVDALSDLLDEDVVSRLAQLLTTYSDQPTIYEDLLNPLLKRGSANALAAAIRAIAIPLPSEGVARDIAFVSARALLSHAPEQGWLGLWGAFQSDEGFATSVLASFIDSSAGMESVGKLTSDRLADLYLWLARRSDAAPVSTYGDSPPSRLASLESRVLDLLTRRGSSDAVAALRRIARGLPSRRWLRRNIRQAEAQDLDQTWTAATPEEVLALSGEHHNRLVRTDDQLAMVVVASLERLQRRLLGPNSVTFGLWDRLSSTNWKPKEEERLSDFIAGHLREDLSARGLIVNREVEVFSRQGGAPGEIPDLIVNSFVPGATDASPGTASVVIEVKGCWHRDLLSAMRTQLVERYMETSGSSAGIYLVGWYVCPQWAVSDSRRSHVPLDSVDELRLELARQAEEVSTAERSIRSFVLDASLR